MATLASNIKYNLNNEYKIYLTNLTVRVFFSQKQKKIFYEKQKLSTLSYFVVSSFFGFCCCCGWYHYGCRWLMSCVHGIMVGKCMPTAAIVVDGYYMVSLWSSWFHLPELDNFSFSIHSLIRLGNVMAIENENNSFQDILFTIFISLFCFGFI